MGGSLQRGRIKIIDDRLDEMDRGEKLSNEARLQFREELASKKPMGGLFGQE
jgi:hypothetical protein